MPIGSALLLQDVAADLQKLVDASFPIGVFDMFLFLDDIRDVSGEAPQSRTVISSFTVRDQLIGRRRLRLVHHVLLDSFEIPLLQYRAQAQFC